MWQIWGIFKGILSFMCCKRKVKTYCKVKEAAIPVEFSMQNESASYSIAKTW
jgi:hypothetical protein